MQISTNPTKDGPIKVTMAVAGRRLLSLRRNGTPRAANSIGHHPRPRAKAKVLLLLLLLQSRR